LVSHSSVPLFFPIPRHGLLGPPRRPFCPSFSLSKTTPLPTNHLSSGRQRRARSLNAFPPPHPGVDHLFDTPYFSFCPAFFVPSPPYRTPFVCKLLSESAFDSPGVCPPIFRRPPFFLQPQSLGTPSVSPFVAPLPNNFWTAPLSLRPHSHFQHPPPFPVLSSLQNFRDAFSSPPGYHPPEKFPPLFLCPPCDFSLFLVLVVPVTNLFFLHTFATGFFLAKQLPLASSSFPLSG